MREVFRFSRERLLVAATPEFLALAAVCRLAEEDAMEDLVIQLLMEAVNMIGAVRDYEHLRPRAEAILLDIMERAHQAEERAEMLGLGGAPVA